MKNSHRFYGTATIISATSSQNSVAGNIDSLTKADLDLLQSERPGYGTRSKIESAFNLVNSTVGAGIIGLPYAVYLAGFYNAIFLSILVSIISQLGLHMLVVSGQRVKAYKFADLLEAVFGRSGYYFLNALIILQAGGSCVSYYILLGDTIPVLLQLYFPQYPRMTDRSLVISLIAIFFILPLNLSRSVGSVARWSILSVLCLPLIVLTLLIRAPAYSKSHEAPLSWQGPDLFGALGILAFAFACSHVCFNVFLSLKDQRIKSWTITTTFASVMSWIASISFAVVGYISFGQDVQANLFLNFPNNDNIVNVGRFALGFSMILTVPMGFYPTREAVQKLLQLETATRQPSNLEHFSVTVILFTLITLLGIKIRSLGKVYALIGGFAATFLAYILPAAACLVTRRRPVVIAANSNCSLFNKRHVIHASSSEAMATAGEHEPLVTPSTLVDIAVSATDLALMPSTISSESESSAGTTVKKNDDFDEVHITLIESVVLEEEQVEDDVIRDEVEEEIPKFGWLDASAIFLIVWGFIVMVFATGGAFK
ncbi:transmembrane amino acid transporter protein-domain-containing protein [Mycotypha africana]|uniref:transmembrane amino acid transporter protein-domain-containing protein n=1 Tax=Mycotypha africana TaxID=64632 RepID=UPI0023006ED4|nr:transmembrane amino acid transporter protein-domain-containing protein [Mycotypha africana]KAI8979175.1 transmembrane amino acid transporter protein-domain-containing protein [Mycotypha africana]